MDGCRGRPTVARGIFSVSIPGDPVPKGRPRFARVGKFVKTFTAKDTLRYEERVAAYARDAVPVDTSGFPLDKALSADVVFVFSRPKSRKESAPMDRKPDIDNLLKSVFDGLSQGGVLKNDARIVSLTAIKEYGDLPETRVRLEDWLE